VCARAAQVVLVIGLVIAGCASQALTQVRGRATYLERMALPPGAVFEATLEDVSKADARSEVMGTARIDKRLAARAAATGSPVPTSSKAIG
jgi:uncharacterized lipoprotein YbaY